MQLDLYQVDAFTDKVFGGNPAAVCPLKEWLPDDVLQNIAMENNLSETAFFVPEGKNFNLRWFTPVSEVDLCGHATLATAFTLFTQLGYKDETITFTGRSGELYVHKTSNGIMMDFPVWERTKTEIPEIIANAFGQVPLEFYEGFDAMAIFENAEDVRKIEPDFTILKRYGARGVLITAPGDNGYDFVSRAFFPKLSIDEDPVTGSAHCILTPYWAERFNKNTLNAHQASERGGDLICTLKSDRVEITGNAVLYMQGKIYV